MLRSKEKAGRRSCSGRQTSEYTSTSDFSEEMTASMVLEEVVPLLLFSSSLGTLQEPRWQRRGSRAVASSQFLAGATVAWGATNAAAAPGPSCCLGRSIPYW